MRIQLKQNEIEAALKSYLASQGIAVSNKAITMDFTAGRKNKGVSVEVVIEDAAPVAAVEAVLDIQDSSLQAAQTDLGSAEQEQEDLVELEQEQEDLVELEPEVKPSVGSLFGS